MTIPSQSQIKKVAILTSYQHEYLKSDFYFASEQKLKETFNNSGIEIHYVSPYYYNEQEGLFSEHVVIGKEDMEIVQEPYKPDLLWVRTSQALFHLDEMFQYAWFRTVPSMRFKHIETDKFQVYKFLEDVQPKTTLLTTFYFYPWLQEQFAEKLVVKPTSWTGWYGVEFYSKEELCSSEVFAKYAGTEWLHIVQEYKNFSDGYPGLVDWNHDVRLVYAGTTPIMNYIRMPKAGSLKSNIATGWRQFSVPMERIPHELLELSKKIHAKLSISKYDLYSLDYAYCAEEKKRYLIEINSAPGIWFPEEDSVYRDDFYKKVADYFHFLMAYSS